MMEQDRLSNRKLRLIKNPTAFCSPPTRQKLIKLKSMRLEKTCLPLTSARVSSRQKTIQKLESAIEIVKIIHKAEVQSLESPFQLILKRSNGQIFQRLIKQVTVNHFLSVLSSLKTYFQAFRRLSMTRTETFSFIPNSKAPRRCLVTREFSYTLAPSRTPQSPYSALTQNSHQTTEKSFKSPCNSFIFPSLASPKSIENPSIFESLESLESRKLETSSYFPEAVHERFLKVHHNLQSFDLPNMSSFESLPVSVNLEEGKTFADLQERGKVSRCKTQKEVVLGPEDLVEFGDQDLEEIEELEGVSQITGFDCEWQEEPRKKGLESRRVKGRYAVYSSKETWTQESTDKFRPSPWKLQLEIPKCYSQFFEEDLIPSEVSFKDYEEKCQISTCVSIQSNSSFKRLEKINLTDLQMKEKVFERLKENRKERKCLYKGLELLSRLFFMKTLEIFQYIQ